MKVYYWNQQFGWKKKWKKKLKRLQQSRARFYVIIFSKKKKSSGELNLDLRYAACKLEQTPLKSNMTYFCHLETEYQVIL